MTSTPAEPFAALLAAAQNILSTTFQTPVQIIHTERLTDEDRRNTVLRCRLADIPAGQPSSVILKQVVSDHYQPDDMDSWDTQRFLRDWIGAEFLTEISPTAPHGPRFYGGDRALGFILMEDLGAHHSLVEPLLEEQAAPAEQALLAFASRLGKLHADTIGTAPRFTQLNNVLNPSAPFDIQRSCLQQATGLREQAELLRTQAERLGIAIPSGFADDIHVIANALADPGPFLAYTHGDPCPDNVFYVDGHLRLIDFEFGHFSHALKDGVYGQFFFPTCWCANQLPEPVIARMEQAYRSELGRTCPAAQDDQLFAAALVSMCGFWLIHSVGQILERALQEDSTWGIATVRSRIVSRLQTFANLATAHNQLPALANLASQLAETLAAHWPDTPPLAHYPAFRS